MNSKLQGVDISVCAVAAPAVVSRELAVGCCDFVTSIVCRVRCVLLHLLHM